MKYKVRTQHEGRWWTISVTEGLPKSVLGVSQAKKLNDVRRVAKDLIADLLEVDRETVEIELSIVLPPELQRFVDAVEELKKREQQIQQERSRAKRAAAHGFIEAGYSYREAGEALGVSHSRIKQLIDS